MTPSGYTTYDKYLEYKSSNSVDALNAANKSGYAEYIFQIGAAVGISEELLNNSNYGTTMIYYSCGPYDNVSYAFVNGNGDQDTSTKGHLLGDVGGFSWGTNALTVRVEFAGSEGTGTKDCHITGLPYTASFYGISTAPSGWTIGGSYSWEGYGWNTADSANYLRLRGNDSYSKRGYALSPEFQMPGDVDVKTILDCFNYNTSSKSRIIYVNASSYSHEELTTNSTTLTGNTTFNNFDGFDDVVNTMTLSSEKSYISITHNVPSEGATTQFIGLKTLNVYYN